MLCIDIEVINPRDARAIRTSLQLPVKNCLLIEIPIESEFLKMVIIMLNLSFM